MCLFLGPGARSLHRIREELAELGIAVHLIRGLSAITAVAESTIALMWAAGAAS